MLREESAPLRLRFRLEIANWSIIKKQNIYISHWRRAATPRFASFLSLFGHQPEIKHDGGQKAIEKQKTLVRLLAFKPKNKYLAFCSRIESHDGSLHKVIWKLWIIARVPRDYTQTNTIIPDSPRNTRLQPKYHHQNRRQPQYHQLTSSISAEDQNTTNLPPA